MSRIQRPDDAARGVLALAFAGGVRRARHVWGDPPIAVSLARPESNGLTCGDHSLVVGCADGIGAGVGTEAPPPHASFIFRHAVSHDAELWRLAARVAGVLELPEQLQVRRGVPERVGEVLRRVGPPTPPGIDTEALLA